MKVVQLGSNKGGDDLSNYLKKNYQQLDFALFVEANSLHIKELKNCYSHYQNIFIENVAIKCPNNLNSSLTIYYHENDSPGYCVASCVREHVEGHYRDAYGNVYGEIKSFDVPCTTIDDLFAKYNIVDLDWLLIDVEGIDAELLLTIDWEKYNIKRIDYEWLHLGDKKEEIENMFKRLGYVRTTGLQYFYDDAWVKPNTNFNSNIVRSAITECESIYEANKLSQSNSQVYIQRYISVLFEHYFQYENFEKALRYCHDFLNISTPYRDGTRVDFLIKSSQTLLKIGDVQKAANYAFHALSESMELGESYLSKAFSYLFSISSELNNPNITVFASGFSPKTLGTPQRKEAIINLANSI